VLSPLRQSVIAFSALQILNNYVQFEVSHGPSDMASMQLSRSRVTDGEWHHLLIELRSAKEGKDMDPLSGHWKAE
jgi:cadherin EGF LAG seven-pass G-type receptor 1